MDTITITFPKVKVNTEIKDGISVVKVNKVPDNLVESCKQAADDCPVEAITCE